MPEKIIGKKKKGKVKYQKENKTKENADIVNHLHEMYWNICNELEAIISK